jgi:hypothetical protein
MLTPLVDANQKHLKGTFKCYRLGQTLFVPHYNEEGVFVAPGHLVKFSDPEHKKIFWESKTYIASELLWAGAVVEKNNLWSTKARRS